MGRQKSIDYYPFGAPMRERSFTLAGADDFRFGFQNQEMDDEIKGEGNSVNFEYRMHDPRVGRFFEIDPLSENYPYFSPYTFSGNQVIHMVELEGLEPSKPPTKVGEVALGSYNGGMYVWKTYGTSNSKWWHMEKPYSAGPELPGFAPQNPAPMPAPDKPQTQTQPVGKSKKSGSIFSINITPPPPNPDANTPWMATAKNEVGVGEETGDNDGPRVGEYQSSTNNKKGDAWCSSFVNWTLKQNGIIGTNSGLALSWNTQNWGQVLNKPAYGAIATMKRKGGGHVAFVAGMMPNGNVVLLGGNQNDSVSFMAKDTAKILSYHYPLNFTPSYSLPLIRNVKALKRTN